MCCGLLDSLSADRSGSETYALHFAGQRVPRRAERAPPLPWPVCESPRSAAPQPCSPLHFSTRARLGGVPVRCLSAGRAGAVGACDGGRRQHAVWNYSANKQEKEYECALSVHAKTQDLLKVTSGSLYMLARGAQPAVRYRRRGDRLRGGGW